MKEFEDIFTADARWKIENVTLENFYRIVAGISLHSEVPKNVYELYERSRNLLLYSWFVYDFSSPAIAQAYATLEASLRTKCQQKDDWPLDRKNRKKTGLYNLFEFSVNRGWIDDRAFTFIPDMINDDRRNTLILITSQNFEHFKSSVAEGHKLIESFRQGSTRYCDTIKHCMTTFRNSVAHGDGFLHGPGNAIHDFRVCSSVINWIFAEHATPESYKDVRPHGLRPLNLPVSLTPKLLGPRSELSERVSYLPLKSDTR